MLFTIKNKSITLDCFTYIEALPQLFPILPTNKALPYWYRNLPPDVRVGNNTFPTLTRSTVKGCSGIKDFFKNSITIPNWIEHRFSVEPNGNTHFMALREDLKCESHDKNIEMGSGFPKYTHIKLTSPWRFRETTGIKWIFTQAAWHQDNPCEFSIPPGIIDYKFQHTTNVNILLPWPENNNKEIIIQSGQPLVNIIPMSDKTVNIKMHVVSREELQKFSTYVHCPVHSYLKTLNILRKDNA